mgnify:CR=1 FL=1
MARKVKTHRLLTELDGTLPATDKNVAKARAFVWKKWRERADELGRPEPKDLTGACKFASIFARYVFGGTLRGNADHQFLVLADGKIVDLTSGSSDVFALEEPYRHSSMWWGNRDHVYSLEAADPRASVWAAEFLASAKRSRK